MPAGSERCDNVEADAAQPDRADLAFVAHRGHRRELVVEVDHLVAFCTKTGSRISAPQIHDVDPVDRQASQIVFDARPQFVRSLGEAKGDGPSRVGGRAHFADDRDAVGRRQRIRDESVHGPVAVELGGVDVVDAQLDRASQQRDGGIRVAVEARELHRAEADAGDGGAAEAPGAARARGTGCRGGRRRKTGHGHDGSSSCDDGESGGTSALPRIALTEEPPL